MFNEQRLVLARKRRRLTAKKLAELSGLSALTIARLEQGKNIPDDETLAAIALALEYPNEFFLGGELEVLNSDSISFRSLSKMTIKERDAAIVAGTYGVTLYDWVEERFSLPEPKVPNLSYENPGSAARSLREHWKIGEKPIGSMIKLLESHGVRVLSISEDTASVDAFSTWRNSRPYIFLNNFKTAEHSTFDAAHELGHLVLHAHGGAKDSRQCEHEANAFASAFLMPSSGLKSQMPRFIKIDTVLKAKYHWRVSAMAMAYRLHALDLLSDWQYKSTCIELGKRGFRSGEPNGLPRDESAIWPKVLKQLWLEKITKSEIANELLLPLDEIEGLIWGLLENHAPVNEKISKTPYLRIVK